MQFRITVFNIITVKTDRLIGDPDQDVDCSKGCDTADKVDTIKVFMDEGEVRGARGVGWRRGASCG